MELFSTLLFIGLVWLLVYNIFYSPKAQIRKLIKEMYNIPVKLFKKKRAMGDEDNNFYFTNTCKKALGIRYKVLIALLDYYFDPEKDEDYIREKTDEATDLLRGGQELMLDKK